MLNEKTQVDLVKPLTDMSISAGYWYKCYKNACAVSIVAVAGLVGTVIYYERNKRLEQKESE